MSEDSTPPPFRPALGPGDPPEAVAPDAVGRADGALRPRSLREFVGQTRVVENLELAITAARQRDEALDHVLLSGLPGLGKTTLAQLIARERGVSFHEVAGPNIDRPADLAGLLTGLKRGDVLFIDEIHALKSQVEEYLYGAMEDFKLVIMMDSGPRARSVALDIEAFTLVGATTREGLLAAPFRARFGIRERLELYDEPELVRIATAGAARLGIGLETGAAQILAGRCRGTPRLLHHLLRRSRDLAQVGGHEGIGEGEARETLSRIGIDEEGLSALDIALLEALRRAEPHPVGLKTLAVSVGEEERTIEDVLEPYLIRRGFVRRTPRGRLLGEAGHAHLEARDRRPRESQGGLFDETP